MKRLIAVMAVTASLTGCGAAAAPCRVASVGLKAFPRIGHVAAAPTMLAHQQSMKQERGYRPDVGA